MYSGSAKNAFLLTKKFIYTRNFSESERERLIFREIILCLNSTKITMNVVAKA